MMCNSRMALPPDLQDKYLDRDDVDTHAEEIAIIRKLLERKKNLETVDFGVYGYLYKVEPQERDPLTQHIKQKQQECRCPAYLPYEDHGSFPLETLHHDPTLLL